MDDFFFNLKFKRTNILNYSARGRDETEERNMFFYDS